MLNKDEILNRTDRGLNVFRHYISFPFKIGRNFLNPLYEDNKASCNIYLDRNSNSYRMKDFGNDDYSGDCFSFVGELKNLDCNQSQDFIEILEIIQHDLCLGSISNSYKNNNQETVPEKKSKPYTIVQKPFAKTELDYWSQFGISPEILKTYKVVSLKKYESESADGAPFTLNGSEAEPMFGYLVSARKLIDINSSDDYLLFNP